ncbi:hypothetical protein N0V83_004395 [Neocucurbitaria cava]|uniref:Uncharacterized protein n=1 Tax=Neocucurbitaria cava TaxID=798079 RepID=A0A9W8Y9N5_9PLEO|nr:hypothetical protein N0V83_004395 [Neocucurbitaria cava]
MRSRIRRKQRHENAKCLKEAEKEVAVLSEKKNQDEFVPRSHKLYDLTKSVDIYVEEVLPMQESGKRARVSRQPQRIRLEPQMTSSEPRSSEPITQSTIVSSRESGPSMNESTASPKAPSTATEPPSDYLNYCSRCKGTCIRTEEHGTIVPTTLESDTGAVLANEGDDDDDDDGAQEPSDIEEASENDGDTNIKSNSVFQPVAGVKGRHPRGWHQRHERSESPQEFWHRKIP